MLSKREKLILQYILEKAEEKETCLISPNELIHSIEHKYPCSSIELQQLLDGLVQENYISVINSDKNGKLVYCITLLGKGKSFERDEKNIKKGWIKAISRTVILAVISFIVGLILKLIFT